jgi:hypothetical protein
MDRVACRRRTFVLVVLGVWLMSASGALASQSRSGGSGTGTLSYRGGPVVHSSRPYLIFWTPPGESIAVGVASSDGTLLHRCGRRQRQIEQ